MKNGGIDEILKDLIRKNPDPTADAVAERLNSNGVLPPEFFSYLMQPDLNLGEGILEIYASALSKLRMKNRGYKAKYF